MQLFLVDDEPSLLQLLGQYLTRQGHTVETAATVAQAKERLSRQPRPAFDYAVVDWTLPDGTGLEVGLDLLRGDEKLRLIFASGYPLDLSVVPDNFRERVRILQKPFLPRALVELLASAA